MNKILVTYATLSGTTVEVARVVAEEIEKSGAPAELLPIGEVKTLDGYAGVVIGAPMIMGWHRSGLGFLGKHRKAWRQLPFAIFATAMSLTSTSTATVDGVPLCIDENLPEAASKGGSPHAPGALRSGRELCRVHTARRRIRQAREPGVLRWATGVWAAAMVGSRVRHAHHSGPGGGQA